MDALETLDEERTEAAGTVLHPCGIERSPSIRHLAAALVQFQAAVEAIPKDLFNPHYKRHYASLDSILKTIKAPLSAAGLSVTQIPCGESLATMLLHTSGEYVIGTYTMAPKDRSPQVMGAALTYARRYALGAVLGVAPDEDDDGESTTTREGGQQKTLSGRPTPDMTKTPQDTGPKASKAMVEAFKAHCAERNMSPARVSAWVYKQYKGEIEDLTHQQLLLCDAAVTGEPGKGGLSEKQRTWLQGGE